MQRLSGLFDGERIPMFGRLECASYLRHRVIQDTLAGSRGAPLPDASAHEPVPQWPPTLPTLVA
jgi:hypothetical protein